MEKKNILLIRTTNSKGIIPPLGLLYIASAIRKKFKGCNIKIIDFIYEKLNDDRFIKKILVYKIHQCEKSENSFPKDIGR